LCISLLVTETKIACVVCKLVNIGASYQPIGRKKPSFKLGIKLAFKNKVLALSPKLQLI